MELTFDLIIEQSDYARELLDRGNGLDAFDTALALLHTAMGVPSLADNAELSERALALEGMATWMWANWAKQHNRGIGLLIRDVDDIAHEILQDAKDQARIAAMQPALF